MHGNFQKDIIYIIQSLLILLVVCWTCIMYSRKVADLRIRIKKKINKTNFEPLSEYLAKHWNQKSV
jgi:hypothetical protein